MAAAAISPGLRDAYIAAVKDPVLALPNTDENYGLLLLVVEEARAKLSQGPEAVALDCEARQPTAETQDQRDQWCRLAARFWKSL